MGKRRKKQSPSPRPKRPCPILNAGIEEVDYKDLEILKQFVTEKGKIIPRRISGLSARSQTRLTEAIKRARNAALLSFAEGYVPQEDEQEDSRSHRGR